MLKITDFLPHNMILYVWQEPFSLNHQTALVGGAIQSFIKNGKLFRLLVNEESIIRRKY